MPTFLAMFDAISLPHSPILWCLPASTPSPLKLDDINGHPSGHMDPDQEPALELLSRATSSVGTEGTIRKEWS